MKVEFSQNFSKTYDKCDQFVKKKVGEKVLIFTKDPLHASLRNHALKGSFSRYRSINITGDLRALYSVRKDNKGGQIAIFEILGTHSQLYK